MLRATIGNGAKILLTLGFLLAPALPADANDAPKQLAFKVVDRNAQQMTDISDAIFYFGELGGLDHRPAHDAGAAAEGARRIRGRVEEDPVFLPGAARRQARCRPQPRRDGEAPRRDDEALSAQDAAVQLKL